MAPFRLRSLGPLALATLAACATAGGVAPAGPPPFEGARAFALVRWVDGAEGRRPPDPLDALAASLTQRGLSARIVEIGPRVPASGLELERLQARAEARAVAAASRRPAYAEDLGREAGDVVRGLGVDVVVLLHRFEAPLLPPLPDPTRPADPFLRRDPPFAAAPLGAFTLVDREGNALAIEWGRPGSDFQEGALMNAAEGVEAVLRVVSGEPLEE